MENNPDISDVIDFVDWRRCDPAMLKPAVATDADENFKLRTTRTADPNSGHTIPDPPDGPIANRRRREDGVAHPGAIAPYLLLRSEESGSSTTAHDSTAPSVEHNDEPPIAKDGVNVALASVEPKRVQPERKAKQDGANGRSCKLSVNEGASRIKTKQLTGGRATRSSLRTKPKVAAPEFVQGSSRSSLSGVRGSAGPSSKAGSGEGLSWQPARRKMPQKGDARQSIPAVDAAGNIVIWGSHKGVEKAEGGYVFGESPLFECWVAGLETLGFPKGNLLDIKRGGICPLPKVDGRGICGWLNQHSHFQRHIYLHTEEVAFWFHCPACVAVIQANRKDILSRHVTSCAKEIGIPFDELLKDAENNEFLHVPCTPALEELAAKQVEDRKLPAEREGLWLPTETALYIKTVKERVGKANANPVKREQADEESSAPPSKKRKLGG